MQVSEQAGPDWGTFPFDKEIVLNAIPPETRTSSLHVSVLPYPDHGSIRVLGRMANGGTGSVTLTGKIYAARLPFADRTIRIQYLGDTKGVQVELESFTLA